MGVVDLDRSTISRSLVRHYEASPTLEITDTYLSVEEGAAALRSGEVYALAILPYDMGKNTILGRSPQVTVFTNNQFLLIGKIITSALLQSHGTFDTMVQVGKNLATGSQLIEVAFSQALPTTSQITPLFNININYGQFLLSAIFPAIWQILMVATSVLSIASAHRLHGLAGWLGDAPLRNLFARLFPLSVFFLLQGVVFLTLMYVLIGWPMHGNWTLLLFTQYVTAWASIAMGTAMFFITRDADLSLSLASSYVAPGLAFMGVTFPVTDMTMLAKIWRSFLPVTHYVEVQFSQVNYGAPLSSALPKLAALSCFSLPMVLVCLLAYYYTRENRVGEPA